ncbi:MAG: tRNA uracil 4-sulfurtransferase ThiI [Clostridiales bacterium]|nr:tRNA uracil 4-sulfurtransferase ThiI [Clostridiales bacterium]MDU1042520.1 tRNA uracil 4-sulfurtransferase ThiI [Clostridiales bacterium]
MYKAFLIKYGEIGLKGKNRHLFEDALVDEIKRVLKKIDGGWSVIKENGRIYAISSEEFDYDEAVDTLTRVFGIVWICPVVRIENKGFEDLKTNVLEYIDKAYDKKAFSFKVDARRARKDFPLNSIEINMELGGAILARFTDLRVDVHKPDVFINVEVRNMINIYSIEIPGPGGMPVGTAGSAMLLLSGGIDSPVAGYMIAKRGVRIHATYFHAPPYTSERAKQKVVDLAEIVSKYAGPITLNIIDFTEIQLEIYKQCPHDEMTIIMRRYMMKIAEHLAREQKCLGLVTGESIGQVASQTMYGLNCTNAVCSLPVYRPLIAFDKQDIIDIADKIGTYETSILPFEDCCTIFVAKHPVTKPKLNIIEKDEEKLSDVIDTMVAKAIENVQIVECD